MMQLYTNKNITMPYDGDFFVFHEVDFRFYSALKRPYWSEAVWRL